MEFEIIIEMIPRTRALSQKALVHCTSSTTVSSRGASIFSGSKTGDFVQDNPTLENQYNDDPLLDKYLKSILPEEVRLFLTFKISYYVNIHLM